MNIKFEIPKWAEKKNVTVFVGNELVAQYIPKRVINNRKQHVYVKVPLLVKSNRCEGCGECCESGAPFTSEEVIEIIRRLKEYLPDTSCPLLTEEGCILGDRIPFSCARSDCSKHFSRCTERFEEIH